MESDIAQQKEPVSIESLLKDRKLLEFDILQLITDFENRYGKGFVTDIVLEHISSFDGNNDQKKIHIRIEL